MTRIVRVTETTTAITVNDTTSVVTVTAPGPRGAQGETGPQGASGTITIQEEGVDVGDIDTYLNFTGAQVTATDVAGVITIDVDAAAPAANTDITSLSGLTGAVTTPTYIDFDTTAAPSRTSGRVWWDNSDSISTLNIGMAGANATLQVGEEMYFRVRASSAITEGELVMFTGTIGASGGLTAAPATGLTTTTGSYVMGVATEDIPLNNWGYVTQFGLVRHIDTTGGGEAWIDGDILYYNPAVAGGLTKTVPTAPAAKVEVAAVVYAHATNGSLFVRVTHFPDLTQLNNVETAAASDTDLLQYNGGSGVWNHSPAAGITVGTATNLASGAANQVAYQTGAGTTGFATAPTTANTFLGWNGSAFEWAERGTVTSVAATVPTGFTIGGSPITTSGTLAISFDTGYSLPTDAVQANWTTAYGWGDHASAGYQAAATALTTSTNFGGDVSGTYGAIVIADDSHNHIIANVDGLQTALDGKEPVDATILRQADVDDTPVDAATTVPISSNWAFDHAALSTAHGISAFGATLVDDVDAAAARSTLGLGSISTQASSSVTITGGSITGITDLAVADGGTGASTAATARVNLLPSLATNSGKVLAVNGGETDVEWITTGGAGTVTSVSATVPTGFTISGSPITTSGTLAFAFDTGYSLPLTTDVANGVTAFGWGNHASAGYITSTGVTYENLSANGDIGTGATQVAQGDHTHAGVYEPADATILKDADIGSTVQAYDADLTTWAGVTPGTGVTTALAVNVGSAGAVITNGGALGTPTSGTLTNCTGLPVAGITSSTSTALGVGSLELGHASDTTISRVGAGQIAIEGVNVVTTSSTDTLTNKTLTSPAITAPTLTGTIIEDVYAWTGTTGSVTAEMEPANGSIQTVTLTGNITALTDNIAAGESITLMIDDGTAYTITWPTMTWVNNGGAAPTLATSGYTVVSLWKVSTTLYGALVGDGT